MCSKLILLIGFICVLNGAQALRFNEKWPITLPYWRETIVKSLVESECVYFRSEQVLACGSSSVPIIECPAVLNITGLDFKHFLSFGIGLDKTVESVNIPVTDSFHLYPLGYWAPNAYMDYLIHVEKNVYSMCLTHEARENVFGIYIVESGCFSKLIDYFVSLKSVRMMDLVTLLGVSPQFKYITRLYIV